ncbi:hypothetical protein CVV68_16845 [Arthrobacter livingstonensis]|uniref:DUF6286 domain-containing protein n=1 Tax=Arthrobacter livingstonensis TaxID=670078 RepID=A0A2V5L557_9MICC|nr:DUF6286 domain-containing protein [Arthrobacter livingstonensis]PYI65712.1 hypothetical protein CVV68_16845 [Arthrobacter livingstonensis]
MSRHNERSTRLRHRPSRTVPALIVSLVLLALSVALVWLSIARLVNGHWPTLLQGPRDWLNSLAWSAPSIWGIGMVAALVGVILLLCAIIPGGFSALEVHDSGRSSGELASPVREQETVMTRRAVARLAKAQCEQIDGVGSASATATARRVHLSIQTPLHEHGDLGTRITASVRARLEETGLEPVPRITATVHSRR